MSLEVIYEDKDLIAINKPHGLLVHRTNLAVDATVFALQEVRKIVKHRVYPTHRLDRKTSGALLFAKSKEVNSEIQQLFMNRTVAKVYIAIVRGYLEDILIDYPLENNGKTNDAITEVKVLKKYEIDLPSHTFKTSRYSLVELHPKTGRFHQLRKHLAHIFHPIIGDRPHGCNKQNKLWKESYNMNTMLLHASSLKFERASGERIHISAPQSNEFEMGLRLLTKNSI